MNEMNCNGGLFVWLSTVSPPPSEDTQTYLGRRRCVVFEQVAVVVAAAVEMFSQSNAPFNLFMHIITSFKPPGAVAVTEACAAIVEWRDVRI